MSEDISPEKRMVLALALTALVLLVWQAFFLPKPTPVAPAQPPGASTAPAAGAPPQETPEPQAPAAEAPAPEAPAPTSTAGPSPTEVKATLTGEEEEVVLSGEELVARLSTRGAVLKQVELTHYAAPFDHDRRLRLFAPCEDVGALLVIDPAGHTPTERTVYRVVERSATHVVMEAAWTNGLRLRKTFRLDPRRFHLDLEMELTNESGEPLSLSYLLVGSPGLNPETRKANDLQASVYLERSQVKTVHLRSLRKGPKVFAGAGLTWVAGANQYFAAALVPRKATAASALVMPAGSAESLARLAALAVGPEADAEAARVLAGDMLAQNQHALTAVLSTPLELAPGEEVTHQYRLFCGPKKDEVLASYQAEGLPALVSFGTFSVLSTAILFILKGFYKVTQNYGAAIILLTVLIKAALMPLSHKSQVSMHRMQQLQPKLKELQERLKDDKQRLGQEQMRLMREHGVNPFGGCLPMLLQFPVFIALFRALRTSFELRQRSFLWIDDLSQPDAVATLPFSLPIIGNTINLLPILWVTSMMLSQKLMPRPKIADPQQKQQQMMATFFPLIFGVMLYNFPAGLFLYFVTMSFLSIAEQRFIRKRLMALAEPTPTAAKPAKPPKRPSPKPARRRKR